MGYDIRILNQTETIKKIKITKTEGEKARNIIYLTIVIILNVFFWVGILNYFKSFNTVQEKNQISIIDILVIMFSSSFFILIINPFLPVIYNLKSLFYSVLYGDVYEINKKKDLLLVNNRKECTLTDIESIYVRKFIGRFGKEENRLYIRLKDCSKNLIQISNKSEDITKTAKEIGDFLSMEILEK